MIFSFSSNIIVFAKIFMWYALFITLPLGSYINKNMFITRNPINNIKSIVFVNLNNRVNLDSFGGIIHNFRSPTILHSSSLLKFYTRKFTFSIIVTRNLSTIFARPPFSACAFYWPIHNRTFTWYKNLIPLSPHLFTLLQSGRLQVFPPHPGLHSQISFPE